MLHMGHDVQTINIVVSESSIEHFEILHVLLIIQL